MHRLAKLTVYWRAHAEAERDAHSQDNFSHTLASDYLMEEEKGQRAENVRVDTRIWSYCCYDRCRDIVVSNAEKVTDVRSLLGALKENGYHVLSAAVSRNIHQKDIHSNTRWMLTVLQQIRPVCSGLPTN